MGHDTEIKQRRGFGDTNFVLFARDAVSSSTAPAPLPEVTYTFDAQGEHESPWKVRRFTATEGLSALYECVVDVANPALTASPDALLGKYALLQLSREAAFRRFYGVIRRVEHRGTVADHRLARVTMVPGLWTLSQRSDARVFQDVTAIEVVVAVLREAGLYVGMLDLLLQRTYPKREYCVQYRETDLDFVLRLLASEGVTFFFRHEEEGETLVLADGAHAWEALRTMDGGPVPIAGPEGATHRVETMRHLSWEREVKPTGVAVRDFDFTRPDFRLERMAPRRREGERNLYEPAPAVTLQQYQTPAYTRDDAQEQAQLRLEAERVDEAVGSGEGNVTGMIPGAMFQLMMAGVHVPPQRYVVARVEHEGAAPEVLTHQADGARGDEERYRNHFRCLPVEAPYRPARNVARPTIAGLQSATVVGVAGEEIYTDEHGRIRVQFHWDRRGARSEQSSCWMRVTQGPWAGNGWGFQFLPRVGMEVTVSFLDGDPDRPVVTGALYNGHNGAPFPLPDARTRSGVRTQTVGGAGFNELSFEDVAGGEQVYLHAQRNHDELVEHDHTLRVRHDEVIQVDGNQTQWVAGFQHETVVGDQVLAVESNRSETVRVNRSVRVQGDQEHRVEGNDAATVAGNADQFFVQDLTTRVGGRARHEVTGAADESVRDDLTVLVHGNQTTVVGRYEAQRSSLLHVEGTSSFWSSRTTEIQSEKDILLRCGRTMIRLTPDRLELISPEVIIRGGENRITVGGDKVRIRAKAEAIIGAPKVVVKSIGAAVKLDAEAKVMGAKVNLGAGSIPLDNDPDDPVKVTTIELKDEEGDAIPHQRFVIRMEDGSEQTGIVNHEGIAVLELDEAGMIVFPDLGDTGPATTTGMRPYVVRQGDYLTRLAHDMGFQTDAVWEHPRNEELSTRREHEDILAPGDVLYVPEREREGDPIEPDTVNQYRKRRPRVAVNLLLMHGDEPLVDALCTVEGLGPAQFEARTDKGGYLSLDVPLHAREVRLEFAESGLVFSLLLGHMDPITEPSGVRARLANLGYRGLEGGDFAETWDDVRLVDAIRTFQQEQHLEATGAMDDATRDALRSKYGT